VVAAGRFAMLNTFVDCAMAELSRNELAVWLCLFRHTRATDGVAAVGQRRLAAQAGISDRTVRRVVCKLAQRGLVKVLSVGRAGGGFTRYAVLAAAPGPPTGQAVVR
jgi:hypothetical protein